MSEIDTTRFPDVRLMQAALPMRPRHPLQLDDYAGCGWYIAALLENCQSKAVRGPFVLYTAALLFVISTGFADRHSLPSFSRSFDDR